MKKKARCPGYGYQQCKIYILMCLRINIYMVHTRTPLKLYCSESDTIKLRASFILYEFIHKKTVGIKNKSFVRLDSYHSPLGQAMNT